MPNSRQTSAMASPSRSRATKRRRSSITELAFHGIHTSRRTKAESVTHVSGTFCYLCLGPLKSLSRCFRCRSDMESPAHSDICPFFVLESRRKRAASCRCRIVVFVYSRVMSAVLWPLNARDCASVNPASPPSLLPPCRSPMNLNAGSTRQLLDLRNSSEEVPLLPWHPNARRSILRRPPGTSVGSSAARPAPHPILGDELRALRRLQREQEPKSPFVFTSERGGPFTTAGFAQMMERAGAEAGIPFKVHPHMPRPACGFALANKG